MIRKLIGTAEVINGKAEYLWNIDENITPGQRKIYVAYVENDGYMASEAWENAYIKLPTTIQLQTTETIVNSTINQEQPEKIELNANITTTNTFELVNEGKVQFQIKTEDSDSFVNIGSPVPVIDGTAVYEYILPDTPQTDILVKAIYLANNLYGGCETEQYMTIHVRGRVYLDINQLRVNPGSSENIIANVRNVSGLDLTCGEVNIYLDESLISRVQSVTSSRIEFNYTFASDLSSGDHLLRIEYLENDLFSYVEYTSVVYVRESLEIEENIIYAPQTIDNNGNIIQATANIPLNIKDSDGNIINTGQVEFKCGEIEKIIQLNVSGENNITYNIPLNTKGGQIIPYALTYKENDNYQTTTITSEIHIKYQTHITLEKIEGELGQTITLTANIHDENQTPTNTGEVQFTIETPE